MDFETYIYLGVIREQWCMPSRYGGNDSTGGVSVHSADDNLRVCVCIVKSKFDIRGKIRNGII